MQLLRSRGLCAVMAQIPDIHRPRSKWPEVHAGVFILEKSAVARGLPRILPFELVLIHEIQKGTSRLPIPRDGRVQN